MWGSWHSEAWETRGSTSSDAVVQEAEEPEEAQESETPNRWHRLRRQRSDSDEMPLTLSRNDCETGGEIKPLFAKIRKPWHELDDDTDDDGDHGSKGGGIGDDTTVGFWEVEPQFSENFPRVEEAEETNYVPPPPRIPPPPPARRITEPIVDDELGEGLRGTTVLPEKCGGILPPPPLPPPPPPPPRRMLKPESWVEECCSDASGEGLRDIV